jgi:predicted dehydrogenase
VRPHWRRRKSTIATNVDASAMLGAARQHDRVVQVGLQRRSTPHLIEAKERFIDEDKLGKIALVEIYCYYHMRAKTNPRIPRRRRISTTMPGLVLLQ